MSKVLIVYFSKTGNTYEMAVSVKEGAESSGAAVKIQKAAETSPGDLLEAQALIIGSPTYYGLPAAELKKLLDETVKYHGQLEGKVGGAFASSANTGGGNETTVVALLQAMLIHGMVIPGSSKGDHYGPVSVGAPDERVKKECRNLGKRVAELAEKLN